MVTFLIILNIVMAGLSIVFFLKYFLIKYLKSSKAIKNVILAIGLILPLFCALGNIFTGLSIGQSRAALEYELTKPQNENATYNGVTAKELIQRDIDKLETITPEIIKYTCAGLASFVVVFVLRKSIIKEAKDFKPSGTWSL